MEKIGFLVNSIDSFQILLKEEKASFIFFANQDSSPFPKKSKIKPCIFKCNAKSFLFYSLLLSKKQWNTKGCTLLQTFCFRECGNFLLYQKATTKSKLCFVAYIHKFDNEAKCIVFSSLQYQVTFKMPLEATFTEGRTSMKFWILCGPQTSSFINSDKTGIWT